MPGSVATQECTKVLAFSPAAPWAFMFRATLQGANAISVCRKVRVVGMGGGRDEGRGR